jgi:type II secretory pathway pseudopilin PulG
MVSGRSRGFSLLELVIAVFTLAALAALSLGGLAGQRERATSEGMARVLTAELESARVHALKNGHPVAICFPSSNGTTPETQSYYLLEGEVRPRATRSRILAGDFPQSSIVNAYWGAAALASTSVDTKRAQMMATWLGTKAGKDFALIFLPDGTVTSNDLPLTDGSYRLLVASGATYSGGTPTGTTRFNPTPNHFQLTGAFAGHTILISSTGRIQLISGILDPGSVDVLAAAPPSAAGPAGISLPADEASTNPVFTSLDVSPEPFLEPKATVQKERNLSLEVTAKDADGDQLYCTWEAEAQGASPGTGFFSLQDNHPMLWDRESQSWVSNSTWAPPPQCDVGDTYKLKCTITDPDGNVVLVEEDILDPVTIIPPGKIVAYKNYFPAPNVYVVNSDGTDFANLVDDGSNFSVSPDGSKFVWQNAENSNRLWVANLDGTGKKQLHTTTLQPGTWSGDGRYVLLKGFSGMSALRADGGALTSIYSGQGFFNPAFTPDGEILIFTTKLNGDGAGRFSMAEFDGSGGTPALLDVTHTAPPSKIRHKFIMWIPGTSREFFYTRQIGGFGGPTETVRAELTDSGSGVGRFQINDLAVASGNEFVQGFYDTTPVFSPDGSRVVYYKQSNGLYIADWTDLGNASLNRTNERKFYNPGVGNHGIKAWIP